MTKIKSLISSNKFRIMLVSLIYVLVLILPNFSSASAAIVTGSGFLYGRSRKSGENISRVLRYPAAGYQAGDCETSSGAKNAAIDSSWGCERYGASDRFTRFAIPKDIVTPSSFVKWLRDSYNYSYSGSATYTADYFKVGAKYIVYNMLGLPSDSNTVISDSQFNELEALLVQYNERGYIHWNVAALSSGGINSGYSKDTSIKGDVFTYSFDTVKSGIQIIDAKGNTLFRIWRICANPIGELKKIPKIPPPPVVVEPSWELAVNTKIRTRPQGGGWTSWKNYKGKLSPVVINIGDSYQWNHTLSSSGDRTDRSIDYYYNVDGDATNYYIGNISAAAGITAANPASAESLEFTATAAGRFCRRTRASGSSSSSPNTPINSGWSCVKVNDPIKWSISPEIEVVNGTVYPGDTIVWNHWVKNTSISANPTDASISFGAVDIANDSYISTIFTQGIGLGVNKNGTKKPSTLNVPVGTAPGKEYCRRTRAEPRSTESNDPIYSSKVCSEVVAKWDIDLTTQIKSTRDSVYSNNIANAQPGDRITWLHKLKNKGPNSTSVDINYDYKNDAILKSVVGVDYGGMATIASGFLANASKSKESEKDWSSVDLEISQNDVGNEYCRSTIVDRISSSGTNLPARNLWHESNKACVKVPYNYELEPHVAVGDEVSIPGGVKRVIAPSVSNAGPTKSVNTQWQLTKFVKTAPSVGFMDSITDLTTSDGPAVYTSVPAGVNIDSGSRVFDKSNSISLNDIDDLTDYLVGTKVCYVLSVKPFSSVNNKWRNSRPVCISIGKKPKVQVWGGDVWSKGGINMLTTLRSNKTYGSWAEYALFSQGFINNMASKSMFNPVPDLLSPGSYSPLSFTNHDSSKIGKYETTRNTSNMSANFSASDGVLTGTSGLGVSSGTYSVSGSLLILTGGVVVNGKTIIINAPNADINIAGNINYSSGDINGIKDIPQLLIIAKNIYIDPAVTNIDAWLVAVKDSTSPTNTGIIDTCNVTFIDIRLAGDCSEPLRINGPVIAKKILLKRTYGSDAVLGYDVPAEIINFRADAYLWAAAQAAKNNTIRTVYSIEQPPRF